MAKGITRCTGMEAKIKWPNDIVINGKKVVGILTEMSAQMDYVNHIVVGIGINVNNESFPEEIAQNATSLLLQSGKRVNRAGLIEAIWEEFEYYYDRFMAYQDLRDLRKEYDASLANKGWYHVTASVKAVKDAMFGGEVGPMFYVSDARTAEKPEEETVYFS